MKTMFKVLIRHRKNMYLNCYYIIVLGVEIQLLVNQFTLKKKKIAGESKQVENAKWYLIDIILLSSQDDKLKQSQTSPT